jgi:zinc-finger of acetyl-transferase ESCO
MVAQEREYARTLWGRDYGCAVCGLEYVARSEDDRRVHRSRHREVLRACEPKPDLELVGRGPFLRIDSNSPRRLRKQFAGMARMFQRELGFDFPPYVFEEGDDERARHWMIISPDGRAIGGLSVRCMTYSNAPMCLEWTWVWVIPSERRHGHTQRCWDMLCDRFPSIEPQTPLSIPVAKFFIDRTDVSERTRAFARRALADPEMA